MKFYTTSKLSENIHETPEGYLVCTGVPIARTGEMIYGPNETPLEVGPDGKVIVERDVDEVFRPETLASFEGKALTIGHPNDFVNPENWKTLAKGIIQNVRRGAGEQENDLIADLLITDSVAIELVRNGLREVSCGYEAEYVQTGEGRGVQKSIIGNHLALVDEGRAGSAYAINDRKGKGPMKLTDKIKAIFAKAQDEALKVAETADEASPVEEKTAKDASPGYDELVTAVKDLTAKISGMAPKAEDAPVSPVSAAPAEVSAKDEPAPVAASLEERLAKLEAMVAKLMATGDEGGEEESEMVGDADEDGDDEETSDEECADADEDDEPAMTGDAASRVEILAPGMKASGKDVKARALKAAYATTDGKTVIHRITGGKAPDLKDEKFVDTLFIATSEILKTQRTSEFSKTKVRDFQPDVTSNGVMTPEKINELNAKHYGNRTSH